MAFLPSKEELLKRNPNRPVVDDKVTIDERGITNDTPQQTVSKQYEPLQARQPLFEHRTEEVDSEEETVFQSDLGKSLDYKIFGCGGFGRTICDSFAKQLPDQEFIVFDTTEYIPSMDNIESIAIPGLDGSAKHRASNYNAIKKFLAANGENMQFDEMNIVVCSCAGGSGSVIAPLLIKEIVRQGKQVVLITAVDKSSEIDTRNSVNSLMSFESMIGDAYIPVVLFDNANGKPVVDKGVKTALQALDTVLANRFNKLDTSDRLMFFAPSRGSDNISKGLKMMGISASPSGDWFENLGFVNPPRDIPILDSCLIICNENTPYFPECRCNLQFNGYHLEDYIVTLTCGGNIPKSLIEEYNSELLLFKNTMATQEISVISIDKDLNSSKQGDGMIL